MRCALILTLASAGVLALAAPASAVTPQPDAPKAAVGAGFSDPDAALEGAGSSLRTAIAGPGGADSGARPSSVDGPSPSLASVEALYAAHPGAFLAHAKSTAASTSATHTASSTPDVSTSAPSNSH